MPMMGSEFNYDANRRQMYRAQVPDVLAKVNELGGEYYYAKDMSAGGIGLDYAADMKIGDPVTISLYEQDELIAEDVTARVAYSEGGYTGFCFDSLDGYQYDAIYDYVQEAQKDDPNYLKYASYYNA